MGIPSATFRSIRRSRRQTKHVLRPTSVHVCILDDHYHLHRHGLHMDRAVVLENLSIGEACQLNA